MRDSVDLSGAFKMTSTSCMEFDPKRYQMKAEDVFFK